MFVYTLLFYSDIREKEKGPGAETPRPRNPPHAPQSWKARAGKRKDGLMNSTPDLLELSGRARIRAMFWPRQRVGLIAAGPVLGLSYPQLHRRIQQGKLALRIRKDEFGQMFVTVDDLADYLFPDESEKASPSLPPPPAKKAKPGRPKKALSGQEEGAR